MSLEQALADNTAAIKALTAALAAGGATAPQAEAPAPKASTKADKKNEAKPAESKPAESKGPSIDDVRGALKAYAAVEGKPAALEKLKTVGGAESVQELPVAKYQAVIDALK